MTNTYHHAERELEILVKSAPDPDNRPIIEPFIPELLALAEKFGSSGQSGGSAPYTASALAQAIKSLCLQEPICDLTGIEEEWNDVTALSDGKTLFQNKRCSALFKTEPDKCYYLDAIVWKTQKGSTWSGSAMDKDGNVVYSRQYVKTFPFTPKTFVIDVEEKEVAPDDWEFYIKDENQLKEVFEYYNPYTSEKS